MGCLTKDYEEKDEIGGNLMFTLELRDMMNARRHTYASLLMGVYVMPGIEQWIRTKNNI